MLIFSNISLVLGIISIIMVINYIFVECCELCEVRQTSVVHSVLYLVIEVTLVQNPVRQPIIPLTTRFPAPTTNMIHPPPSLPITRAEK